MTVNFLIHRYKSKYSVLVYIGMFIKIATANEQNIFAIVLLKCIITKREKSTILNQNNIELVFCIALKLPTNRNKTKTNLLRVFP